MPSFDELKNLNLDLTIDDSRRIVFYCMAGEPWCEYIGLNDHEYDLNTKYQDVVYITANSNFPIWKTVIDEAFVMYCKGLFTEGRFNKLYANAVEMFCDAPEVLPYG